MGDKRDFLGLHSGMNEVSVLVEYGAVSLRNCLTTFQDNVVVSSLSVLLDISPPEDDITTRCLEKTVTSYSATRRPVSEERFISRRRKMLNSCNCNLRIIFVSHYKNM